MPPSSKPPKITVKKQKKIAFQIGHTEIGKIIKLGGIWRQFWGSGLRADLQLEGC